MWNEEEKWWAKKSEETEKKQRKAEAKRKRLKNCKKSIADIFPEEKEEGYDTTQDAVDDENSSRK